jgi:sialic acid synthase SpsE
MSKRAKKTVLIHTQLSHPIEDANLKAISRLANLTGKKVAFGLHCADIFAFYLAIACEPSDVFFYVKESSKISYPDDQHAIMISDLGGVLAKVGVVKKALGNGVKVKGTNGIK